jgi:DNA-damage-inducible protein J
MDADVKNQFDIFCNNLGMNTSTAFNMFACSVLREKRLPFDIATETDPFYCEKNQSFLREAIASLNEGKGVAHELIEVDDE